MFVKHRVFDSMMMKIGVQIKWLILIADGVIPSLNMLIANILVTCSPVFKQKSLSKESFWRPKCSTRWLGPELSQRIISLQILTMANLHKRVEGESVEPHPRLSETSYVSAASWQTRFHSSAPVSRLQGVVSEDPAVRPRRLDFFLVSSPTKEAEKFGTNRQLRKWLTAAEKLGTSTPCKDISRQYFRNKWTPQWTEFILEYLKKKDRSKTLWSTWRKVLNTLLAERMKMSPITDLWWGQK